MKKKFFAPLMGALVLGLSAYVGYRTYDAYVEKETESNLLLENIEALANEDETVIMQRCTRAKKYGSCYDDNNMWKGTYIDEVEVYEVAVGSPIVCFHDAVHPCPEGTHR